MSNPTPPDSGSGHRKRRTVRLTKDAADHVFEAQTLTNFITWLAAEDGVKVGTTYDKPSADWVREVVLANGVQRSFQIVSPGNTNAGSLFTPSTGEIPVTLMAYGFGRSDGVKGISGGKTVERIPTARGNKNLVLLHVDINGPKGIYFKRNKLNSLWSQHANQRESRREVRRVSTSTSGYHPRNMKKKQGAERKRMMKEKKTKNSLDAG